MSKHPLEIILGSRSRHKILRFLYRNIGQSHTNSEIAARTQEDLSAVRKEMDSFIEAGLIVEYKEKRNEPR
ncbi:MAG TPA: winged helix-turn-helix domain-containing protein [Candidatus Paceibacterota bacterium]